MRLLNKQGFLMKLISMAAAMFFILQPEDAFAKYEPILDPEDSNEGNKPNIVEKFLSKLLMNVSNWLVDVSNAQDVSVLVFQRSEIVKGKSEIMTNASSANRDGMVFNIFPSGLFDGISAFNSFFTQLLPIPMVVILTGVGLFLIFDLMRSSENRAKWKDVLFGSIVAVLLMRFGHILWDWIIFINFVIVDGIYVVLKENGVTVTRFVNTIWDSSQYSDLTGTQSLGVALMIIVATFMTFTINYQYMMRMLTLGILIIMFPFVLLTSIIPSRKGGLNLWFSTFVSNVFMQAGHAVALGLFFYALTKASSISFWLVLTMLFGLPAMADVVNRMVGAFTGEGSSGGLKTSMSNMSGMSGMMAINKIGSQAMGKMKNPVKNPTSDPVMKDSFGSGGSFGQMGNTMGSATAIESSGENNSQNGGSVGISGGNNGNSGVTPMNAGLKSYSSKPDLSRTRQVLSKVGKGTIKAGRAMSQSEFGRQAVSTTAALGTGMAGYIAGAMTTGNGAQGAFLGAQASKGISRAADYTRNKLGKVTELGGEMLHSGAEKGISHVMDATKERLGFEDSAQLASPMEAKRIGEELIGGKTGQAIGAVVGVGGNLLARAPGNSSGQEKLKKLRDINNLGEQMDVVKQQHAGAKEHVNFAQSAYNNAQATYGPHTPAGQSWSEKTNHEYREAQQALKANPNNRQVQERFYQADQNRKLPHPEVQKAQQQLDSAKGNVSKYDFQHRQLEMQKNNYYRISREANNMRGLQQEVRSSGRL